jgi:hypothetical protein
LKLKTDQIQDLNKAWNSIYRKIFGYNKWESVKSLILAAGKLDFKHLKMKLYMNFIMGNLNSYNRSLKYLVLRNLLTDFVMHCEQFNIILDVHVLPTRKLSCGQVNSVIFCSFNTAVEVYN